MRSFAFGVVVGWALILLIIHAALAYLGPPAILWSDYGKNISISYFKNMDECSAVRERNKGALDSACLRAEVVTGENPLYIEVGK